jgi:hypothetical protein
MIEDMAPPQPYRSAVLSVAELDEATVAAMEALYLRHYDGSSSGLFRHDLTEKRDAVLLYHGADLVGFTLLMVMETLWRGVPVRAVYSGDTIVGVQHWGQQQLNFTCIARIGQIKREQPSLPLYWFLLVKGHRTFKYLPVFVKSFFPHWQEARPDLQELAQQLAQARFGDYFDASKGIVHFPDSRGHLKAWIAEANERERARASTQFFLQKNPGYRQGDELVCLCELEPANLKPLTARLFAATRKIAA